VPSAHPSNATSSSSKDYSTISKEEINELKLEIQNLKVRKLKFNLNLYKIFYKIIYVCSMFIIS
jgi:hypothetical protein